MSSHQPDDIGLETYVCASEGQLTSQLGDESVILSLGDGMYYGLDSIGTRVWAQLTAPRKIGDICAEIERDYDVSAKECETAVLSLVRELAARSLVDVRA